MNNVYKCYFFKSRQISVLERASTHGFFKIIPEWYTRYIGVKLQIKKYNMIKGYILYLEVCSVSDIKGMSFSVFHLQIDGIYYNFFQCNLFIRSCVQ